MEFLSTSQSITQVSDYKMESLLSTMIYYGAEGGVLELLETGAPYAPHVKAKITWKRKLEFLLTHSVWNGVKVVCAVFRQVLE